jgi:hypothetical protein
MTYSCFGAQRNLTVLVLGLILVGCSTKVDRDLEPVSFTQLPGWHQDHQLQTLPAMVKSCDVILKKSSGTEMVTRGDGSGEARDWLVFVRS